MTLLEDINNNLNLEGLSELEIARLLYIELAKRVYFSTKFQNTSEDDFFKMFSVKVDLNTFSEKEVNCVMWAQLYSALLDRFGISNRIVDMGHRYVEFFIDGEKWVADATHGSYTDLSRIHNSDDTHEFGLSLYQHNDEKSHNVPIYDPKVIEKLKEIDIKIGYNNEEYKDLQDLKELIKKIRNKEFDINEVVDSIGSTETEKKLNYLFAKLGVLTLGFYEAKDFVHELMSLMFDGNEMMYIHSNELKKTNPNGSVDIVQILSIDDSDGYHYYIVSPNLPVREISSSDITKLAILGYGKEKPIPGVIYPSNFVPGEKMKAHKFLFDKTRREQKILSPFLQEYKEMRR